MALLGGRLEERYSPCDVFGNLSSQNEWVQHDIRSFDLRSFLLAACCLGLLNAYCSRGWNMERVVRGVYKYLEQEAVVIARRPGRWSDRIKDTEIKGRDRLATRYIQVVYTILSI
jgi:hypothetical protein